MRPPSVRRLTPYLLAILAVAAMSLVIGVVLTTLPITKISILYLVVVLAIATRLGRGPAILASLAAFLIYDWFFTEPYHQLTIRDPDEWISLGLFLVTAIITSELAGRERLRAEEARRREREAVLLFDALRLMGGPDLDAALKAVAERIRTELRVAGASIEVALEDGAHHVTSGVTEDPQASTRVLGEGKRPTTSTIGGPTRWIRVVPPYRAAFSPGGKWRRYEIPVRVDDRTVGRLRLLQDAASGDLSPQQSRMLALIASLLGSVAQRADLREATTRAEVLRRTDELKTTLLNAVSHDLRTPLASIVASAGSLRQRDVRWSEREREEFAEAIEQQAERLSRIVGNLLDLSRIEAGVLRPDKQLHDFGALVDDVVARLRPVMSTHRVGVHIPDDLPPVALDRVQIDQVLSNLLENAVKYAPAGSEIVLGARHEDGRLTVEVSDRGPGIPPEELDQLFTPFHRAATARRRTRGFGVGLAVAKGLVEAHGGTIWAGNRPDGGARFTFTLPLTASAVPVERVRT